MQWFCGVYRLYAGRHALLYIHGRHARLVFLIGYLHGLASWMSLGRGAGMTMGVRNVCRSQPCVWPRTGCGRRFLRSMLTCAACLLRIRLLQLQADLIGHVDRAHSQITSRLELGLPASSESASSGARAGRNEGRFNRAAAESVAVASAMVTGASDDGGRSAAGDGEAAGAVEEAPWSAPRSRNRRSALPLRDVDLISISLRDLLQLQADLIKYVDIVQGQICQRCTFALAVHPPLVSNVMAEPSSNVQAEPSSSGKRAGRAGAKSAVSALTRRRVCSKVAEAATAGAVPVGASSSASSGKRAGRGGDGSAVPSIRQRFRERYLRECCLRSRPAEAATAGAVPVGDGASSSASFGKRAGHAGDDSAVSTPLEGCLSSRPSAAATAGVAAAGGTAGLDTGTLLPCESDSVAEDDVSEGQTRLDQFFSIKSRRT